MTRTGHPFIEIPTVESTNIYAMEQARARLAGPGTAFFAHEQTRGRGQRGRAWQANPGENIALSLIVEPPDRNPVHGFPLSCATAMGCYDFYKKFAGDETAIKWPNDLYWRDRKAGGILIENIIRSGTWELAIVGIGINVNQVAFDPALPNPVALKQITGRDYSPVDLARELCDCLDQRWQSLAQGAWPRIFSDYQEILFGKGRSFPFRSGDEDFEAIVHSVTENGKLELWDGSRFRHFAFGQLEWRSLRPVD
jgi:BirA family transcriptional regulator, biotin operon repressor / biotin---[acetyl-CoA-carboxylase] ligase